MKEITGHYRKTCDMNYLGNWDLAKDDGFTEIVLTIASVGIDVVIEPNTNSKSEETIITFAEKNYKPMILNTTNKKAIAKATGSDFVENWKGKQIKIGVEKVKAFGDVHNALRVRPTPPVIEKAKCEVCGKEVQKSVFDGTKAKCGFGVCSTKCRDTLIAEGKINETTN